MAARGVIVIRQWLDRMADRLMDHKWLRGMRKREVESLRAVHHIDRQARLQSWPESTVYPERTKRGSS